MFRYAVIFRFGRSRTSGVGHDLGHAPTVRVSHPESPGDLPVRIRRRQVLRRQKRAQIQAWRAETILTRTLCRALFSVLSAERFPA